jgi:hypothetical protein
MKALYLLISDTDVNMFIARHTYPYWPLETIVFKHLLFYGVFHLLSFVNSHTVKSSITYFHSILVQF